MGTAGQTKIAGLREAGSVCAQCRVEIQLEQQVTTCQGCGNTHHTSCWEEHHGCGSWDCSPARTDPRLSNNAIRITANDLEAAVPLTPVAMADSQGTFHTSAEDAREQSRKPLNRWAIASFVIGLIAIPAFGIVTGLVAVIVGCIALVAHSNRKRGYGFAVAGVLLGIASFCGWAVGLYAYQGSGQVQGLTMEDFEPDPEALREMPEPIGRAMHANVLIQTSSGLFSQGIGSGVILKIDENSVATILTNRHVVDSGFPGNESATPDAADIIVKIIGQPAMPGRVEWVATEGVDLAIVTTSIISDRAKTAEWNVDEPIRVGSKVFAVGNPHGFGWTHTSGDISQIRRQTNGSTTYRVIQTSAAINPGNSGGGLYTESGELIGINAWTQDKRVGEGLGFAIDFKVILEIAPPRFSLSKTNK